ncbi:hypothetical protein BDW75DRAFT_249664 [Aspergillus navahoensis]
MRRFERIYDVVESVEDYCRGGYHPVHLHDIFNQRYEAVGKLGFGRFSTVWLVHDLLLQKHIALKILKADAYKELPILLRLEAVNLDHPGKRYVLELLDHFKHDSPNGTHLCLVLPVIVSDNLDFLHTLGIVHCVNIMVSTVGAAPSKALLGPPEFSPVRWLEGTTVDGSAPHYFDSCAEMSSQLNDAHFSDLLVKIGDLGGIIQEQGCNHRPVTPTALRATELIHQNSWNAGIDVWALGCLIFELATNEPLFPLGAFGLSAGQIDKEHLCLISQLLDGHDNMNEAFVKHLTDRLPPEFGAKNIQRLTSFLQLMLHQDPKKRTSTAELPSHPFLVPEIEG